MKFFLILSLLTLFRSTLYAEEISTISIKTGDTKAISCNIDTATKVYICPNDGDPILVKKSPFGFSAIAKKNKMTTVLAINHVEADGKVLYEAPSYSGSWGMGDASFKPDTTNDLTRDYRARLIAIDNFFETSNKSKIVGSEELEKIAQTYLQEKLEIEDNVKKLFSEKNYSIELEDGQKINCSRGETRPLSNDQKNYEKKMDMKIQCGSFECDPVKVNGKEFQATLLYDSAPSSMISGSIHLIDKDGIGPLKIVKKIASQDASLPLIDNSYYLENANKYSKNYNNSNEQDNFLPVSLKKDSAKFAIYKDPNFAMIFSYYKNICGNDKALGNLLEGKNKLLTKLAEADMAEFIQILADGSLVGEFVDPTLAPRLGCFYQGVYLNEEAAKHLDRLKRNIHLDAHVDQTISMGRATELFNKAANMKDIAWKYKVDGCYARAHLMARRFEAEGVRVDKVWIKGDLYVPGTDPVVQWNFHVAPIVYVDDGKGNIQKMVIDPSLFDKPVTVDEWDHKMSKTTVKGSSIAAFPFPQNAAFMERSTLSFSSSDPYLPRESIDTSESDKMQMADDTMKRYKEMEP